MSALRLTEPDKFTGDELEATYVNDIKGAVNNHAGLIDQLRDDVDDAGTGTVTSVNDITPNQQGNVTLPAINVYGYSIAKRAQVFGLFTSPSQVKAVDVSLAGDTSTGIGSRIPDFNNGDVYELLPDPDNPDANGNGTPTWIRY